jgi:hypothetical protein
VKRDLQTILKKGASVVKKIYIYLPKKCAFHQTCSPLMLQETSNLLLLAVNLTQ